MKRYEIIERLCVLCSVVGDTAFGAQVSADCFCDANCDQDPHFKFEETVVKFIEDAVIAQIAAVNLSKPATAAVQQLEAELEDAETKMS